MRLSWIIPVGPVSSQGSLEVKEQERRVRGLKQHKLFYSSVVHDTKMGLTELKKKIKESGELHSFLEDSLEENPFLCPFQLPEAPHIPWLLASFHL